MDLKDAVDLYRDVLRRYSEGFSLEEVLRSICEAMGGRKALLFVRREMSSLLEPRLVWNLREAERESVKGKLLSLEWLAHQPASRYVVVRREKLSEFGMDGLLEEASDVLLLFPIRSHAHLRAALLLVLPKEKALPEQQSFKVAAISAVLERMVELFSFEEKAELREDEKEHSSVELGILSNYLVGQGDYARAASLSLDLLIKLLNMDGGTLHRISGAPGAQRASLIASRGWGGMPEIIEHLFENNLIDLLQTMRRSEEGEFSLDAGRIAEYFPGVKPYFHANQVKSFMLTPIFRDDRLVGLLALFGKAYTAMEPRDMDLLVRLTHRLGDLLSEGEGPERQDGSQAEGLDLASVVEELERLSEGALDVEEFLSSALRVVSIELGASMAFAYFGEERSAKRSFLWYADAVYGGESVFTATPGLEHMAVHLQRMAVVKPENPAMRELPGCDQAAISDLVLLLVPAREMGLFLIAGFYLPRERKLTRSEVGSLRPLVALALGLARGLKDRAQAESYRRSLEILTRIEGDLTACEDPDRILRILARGGRELLDCDRAAAVIFDEESGSLKGEMEGEDGLRGGELELMAGREIALALERGHALYSPQRGEDGESVLREEAGRSLIVVPLIGRKGKLGALVFEKSGRDDFFGEFQRRLAHFLAGQAVSVLESHRESAKLGGAAEETRALLRISRSLSPAFSLEEMGGGLYRELQAAMGAELLLLSVSGRVGLRRLAWFKEERADAASFDELLEGEGPLMLALLRGGRVVRNNLNTFLRGPGEDELALMGVRSYMAVALRQEDNRGMLLVGSTRGGAFGEKEISLVEKAAGLVSSTLAVPLRHEELQGRIRHLEEMCRSQEEKIRLKTDLINIASHEIRHPLTLIMGFSEVLRDYGDTLDLRESREVVEKLNKAADRLRRSVINMMEVSRLESGKMSVQTEEVDLGGLLRGLVEELQARYSDNAVEVEVEKGAERICADRDKLEIILFNLMDNAVKYSPPGSRVSVFARRGEREILVGVKDQGQGISEEQLNSIFQPFSKGEGRELGLTKGMGLGLYIVSRLVEAHGGRVEVRSERGRGSTFIARFPQPDSGGEASSFYNEDAMHA